jgi:predicted PhzF superfamily epimerase YddE/YHI9
MKTPFAQIDAFVASAPAGRRFTGNPAAVMPFKAWPDDPVLQAIAAENNLAETAFLVPDTQGTADYELRWFTPTVEIALCGHATLASGHWLIGRGQGQSVRFRTRRSGVLTVHAVGDGYELDLPALHSVETDRPDLVAPLGGEPLTTRWHPGGYLLAVYASEADVRALRPDFRALAACVPGDVLYVATAPGTSHDVVSRVFAPGAGIDEDPVTGSAHCLLTPYWADRLGRDSFTAYQASSRGGDVGCRLVQDRAILSGRCATVIEGEFAV